MSRWLKSVRSVARLVTLHRFPLFDETRGFPPAAHLRAEPNSGLPLAMLGLIRVASLGHNPPLAGILEHRTLQETHGYPDGIRSN
jgi:hypothetical protein